MTCPAEDRLAKGLKLMPSGCQEWQKYTTPKGYGRIRVDGKSIGTHILAWELENKRKRPKNRYVLHSCNNPPCCNPKHLRLGTQKNNMDDMYASGRDYQSKITACPKGHDYTKENTRTYKGKRNCRKCGMDASRRYLLKREVMK